MTIKIAEKPLKSWDEYIEKNPNSTVYHLSGWIEVIRKTFNHKPFYLYSENNGVINGILPLFYIKSLIWGTSLVSVPFVSYGGVCADNDEIRKALEEKAIEIGEKRGVKQIEFRNTEQVDNNLFCRFEKVTFVLDVSDDEDTLLKSFRKQTRNRIRKSLKGDTIIKKGHLYLDDFYKVFSISMREHGTPVMPFSFFLNVLEIFKDKVDITLAYKDRIPIGAKMAMKYKNTYYLIWGAYPSAFRKEIPNYLLTWDCIKDAKKNGIKYLDFGRSSKDTGPYAFKKYFSGKEVQLYWQYWQGKNKDVLNLTTSNPKFFLAINIWKRLPLKVTQILGPKIVKYIP